MSPQYLSVLTLWSATALYAVAMVAWSIRLSRVADERAQERAGAEAPAQERVAVSAGASTSAEDAAASSHADEADDSRSRDDAAVAAMAAGATSFVVDDGEDSAPPRSAANRALGTARTAMYLGLILHAVGLVARGIEAGHVPWSNMYEYTITGSFVAVLVFAIVQSRRDAAYLGTGVTGFATFVLGLGLTQLYAASTGLRPALQSFWIVIHVSIAIIATGVFTVAAVATVLQLIQYGKAAGRFRWLEAVPSAQKLEALAFRLNAVGFVLWTFTVMTGAVWAEHAWGRYWGWDPKEVWSFVIWVLYAAYLHARTTQGWMGKRSAWLSLVGFVALLMNFTVVNLFFQGLHSYA
ncbi:c-type cytochrome biogenesis protein CcsB [Demequina sp. NBRC 110054]|uniref:c-type cytochrome biogenesis protein CcsB n=1 Tax=Demequina sp. NBRC 110054 TaxID=1570343 RepID=UPI000A04660D|nr:c-type cytochrome biogenesis protein CcsB [Demequina sp. NBRC 110054]